MTFDAPPVAGGTQACEEYLMSNETRTARVQSGVYAKSYAILTHPIHPDYGVPAFMSRTGTTTWPCRARLFDTAGDAIATKIALGLPDAEVVRIKLTYTAEAVEMAKRTKMPAGIRVTRRRKVA